MHQRSGLRNVRLYGASSVHGEQKWPILRIPRARNLAWPDSIGQIGFPNNPPQDRFETKAIAERNDGPISRYHTSPDLVVARPLFNSEREIRVSDKHDRRSVPLKFAVARLAGNEMHLLRLDPSVEPRVSCGRSMFCLAGSEHGGRNPPDRHEHLWCWWLVSD
jgi:hypothetical protein